MDRFWSKVDRRNPDECWPWLASADQRGYGVFYCDGKRQRATRVSWAIENGKPFPTDLDACHTCDNPGCVNPAHIWPGTPSENAKDALRKGRLYIPDPSQHANPNKTHCKRGHPLSGENLTMTVQGHRSCKICLRVHREKWRKAHRAKLRIARAALTNGGKNVGD